MDTDKTTMNTYFLEIPQGGHLFVEVACKAYGVDCA